MTFHFWQAVPMSDPIEIVWKHNFFWSFKLTIVDNNLIKQLFINQTNYLFCHFDNQLQPTGISQSCPSGTPPDKNTPCLGGFKARYSQN